jgi:hypothetical protein
VQLGNAQQSAIGNWQLAVGSWQCCFSQTRGVVKKSRVTTELPSVLLVWLNSVDSVCLNRCATCLNYPLHVFGLLKICVSFEYRIMKTKMKLKSESAGMFSSVCFILIIFCVLRMLCCPCINVIYWYELRNKFCSTLNAMFVHDLFPD